MEILFYKLNQNSNCDYIPWELQICVSVYDLLLKKDLHSDIANEILDINEKIFFHEGTDKISKYHYKRMELTKNLENI